MKDNVGDFLLDKRINAVIPHVKGKLLDMCCGSNQLVKKYPGEGLGIDIQQWGNVDVIFEDASKLPFNDKTFDTITILASLNYIPNKLEVLQIVTDRTRTFGFFRTELELELNRSLLSSK